MLPPVSVTSRIFCKLRETDQQPRQMSLSQVAFAQTRQSMAFQTASNAFPEGNGCKKVIDLSNGHFSSNYKTGKKKHVVISFRLRKLEDSGYVVATHYKSARNLPTNIMEPTDKHQQPLNLHLTSGTCSLGIFQRLSRTCKTKDERTHTRMMSSNSNR